ncbi:hypothetical protein R3P38DRAFT_2564356 [Favolaschia claudopus]
MERLATELLAHFKLKFQDIRLLLTATGCAIVGSSVLALARPDLRIVPSDLDVVTACRKGPAIADFFTLAACYVASSHPMDYGEVAGIGSVYTLTLGGVRKINIIESLTDNPLDAVVQFNFSCVFAAWQADGIWLAYPELTSQGLAITTRAIYPMPVGFYARFHTWCVLHKYARRGFKICLNDYPRPHKCGVDLNCPATLRSSDDEACCFYAFPRWRYTSDSGLPRPTCWTLGGTGCSSGILHREDREITTPVFSAEGESSQLVTTMTQILHDR